MIDHLVLTTAHEADCIRFYTQALGMRLETFVGGTPPVERKAFVFGAQKINLHVKGREFEPKAHTPVPGALDLCFIAAVPLIEVIARLQAAGVPIIEGPVLRAGGNACPRARARLRPGDWDWREVPPMRRHTARPATVRAPGDDAHSNRSVRPSRALATAQSSTAITRRASAGGTGLAPRPAMASRTPA